MTARKDLDMKTLLMYLDNIDYRTIIIQINSIFFNTVSLYVFTCLISHLMVNDNAADDVIIGTRKWYANPIGFYTASHR